MNAWGRALAGIRKGDFRDWSAVKESAAGIADALAPGSEPPSGAEGHTPAPTFDRTVRVSMPSRDRRTFVSCYSAGSPTGGVHAPVAGRYGRSFLPSSFVAVFAVFEPAGACWSGLSAVEASGPAETSQNEEASMLKNSPFYAGFAVDDPAKAKEFYGQKLGVFEVVEAIQAERARS